MALSRSICSSGARLKMCALEAYWGILLPGGIKSARHNTSAYAVANAFFWSPFNGRSSKLGMRRPEFSSQTCGYAPLSKSLITFGLVSSPRKCRDDREDLLSFGNSDSCPDYDLCNLTPWRNGNQRSSILMDLGVREEKARWVTPIPEMRRDLLGKRHKH